MRALQGTFAFFSCAALFRHLWERRATGMLLARRGGEEKRLGIEKGEVVFAVSNHPAEFLGRMLVEAGHLTEEAILLAHRTQQETRVPLGRILAMTQAVPTEVIQSTLERKFRRAGSGLLSWSEGEFVFDLEAPPTDRELPASVPLLQLLEEGGAQGVPPPEESSSWRGWFPSRAAGPLIDREPPGEDPLAAAKQALAAGDAGGAVELLERAAEKGRTPELVALLRTAEERLLVRLRAELLQGEPKPHLVVDREAVRRLPLTPPERYLLLRMDGKRPLEALLQVAPARQVDALRFIRRVLDEGLIRY